MPEVVVIAGPNGAGKSTVAPNLLKKHFGDIPFINADLIAEELRPGAEIEAGRLMLSRMRQRASHHESFAFETTLAARTYLRFLRELQEQSYSVQIAYLWLRDVELSIQRVAERVRLGGHDIPIATIRRRFDRGLQNFLNLYLPTADAWRFYDASGDKPQLIASGDKLEGDFLVDKSLWQTIKKKFETR